MPIERDPWTLSPLELVKYVDLLSRHGGAAYADVMKILLDMENATSGERHATAPIEPTQSRKRSGVDPHPHTDSDSDTPLPDLARRLAKRRKGRDAKIATEVHATPVLSVVSRDIVIAAPPPLDDTMVLRDDAPRGHQEDDTSVISAMPQCIPDPLATVSHSHQDDKNTSEMKRPKRKMRGVRVVKGVYKGPDSLPEMVVYYQGRDHKIHPKREWFMYKIPMAHGCLVAVRGDGVLRTPPHTDILSVYSHLYVEYGHVPRLFIAKAVWAEASSKDRRAVRARAMSRGDSEIVIVHKMPDLFCL